MEKSSGKGTLERNHNQKDSSQNQDLICSVKNCGRKIEPGKEIRIENNVYCPLCGGLVMKSLLGI